MRKLFNGIASLLHCIDGCRCIICHVPAQHTRIINRVKNCDRKFNDFEIYTDISIETKHIRSRLQAFKCFYLYLKPYSNDRGQ